jgi:hypothetical protein
MSVTNRYKTVNSVTKDWLLLIAGTLFMCSGPILAALGVIGG